MKALIFYLVLWFVLYVGFMAGSQRGLRQCYPYAVPHDVAIHQEGNQ